MKNPVLHRFFLPIGLSTENLRLLIDKKVHNELFHQLNNVLRVQPGDQVIFLDRTDPNLEYLYKLVEQNKKELIFSFQEKKEILTELPYFISLAVALPAKPDTLAQIIQKATELGVKSIFLLKTEFAQLRHPVNIERLEKIATEASEQSGRGLVPVIYDDTKIELEAFLKKDPQHLIAAIEREGLPMLNKEILQKFINQPDPFLSVLIGPEGGFSEHEKELIYDLNIPSFTLGKIILRMDTAVISSLSLINYLLSN